DFLHIHPTKSIRVTVPVRLIGIADGVKNFGGILQQTMRDVEAEGLPADLPDLFEVDVTPLNIHEAIHVHDLAAERVTIVSPPERTIATVVPPTVVKEVTAAEEAAAAAEGAEPAEGEEAAEKKEGEGEKEKKTE
ncbi:MAG TPA: 50S ribosomal protein L25, partial [Acidobacteriota bacterium]|nr:50S ribosomal protein L25 [Acidobacteriota bacterium]